MKYANDNLKEKEYNYNLGFLKLLACIGVIGLHTFMPNAMILYYLCGFAVPVFFMASGYLIFGKEKITWEYNLVKIMKIIRLILIWCLLRYCIVVVAARFILGSDTFDYEIEILVEDIIGSFIQRGSFGIWVH